MTQPIPLSQIARNLRNFGYPGVDAKIVLEQLRLPKKDRNIIGRFAATMLVENGIWESDEQTVPVPA